ncbi:MAG TPA: tetratricopeptide repeat protein [Gaiellaceae bacterium]|nr:tetratricopeptide repeat protein [Gaiellaceae bacterium]
MSRRARVYLVIAVAAAAAAALAVAGALLQSSSGEGDSATGTEPGMSASRPPGLELDVLVRADRQARVLRAAEASYDRGDRAAARRRFEAVLRSDPDSVEAAVGAAISAWPNGTIDELGRIVERHPDSGVARLHLGLALLAAGDQEGAEAQWRETERRDPDSPAALTAEDLLHPAMPPGRPFFLPTRSAPRLDRLSPARQLGALAARAEEGGVADWILYGTALQRAGRPVSARAAFDRALEVAPNNIEAEAAAAVARFDKDDPSQAFSRLGPLANAHPRSPVVRFHLGLMLLWLRDVEPARRQLRLAAEAGPASPHAEAAASLLRRLRPVRS